MGGECTRYLPCEALEAQAPLALSLPERHLDVRRVESRRRQRVRGAVARVFGGRCEGTLWVVKVKDKAKAKLPYVAHRRCVAWLGASG